MRTNAEGRSLVRFGARPLTPQPSPSIHGTVTPHLTAQASKERDERVSRDWRREHAGSGLTSRLILTYVEREAGGQAIREVLESANLSEAEAQLLDENHWFSYETKLRLWSAAEEVLGDPHVAEHVGAAVLELSVAMGLKRTLRALGTPAFVYGNVARANAKFNWAHQLEVVSKDATSVRMRYVDLADVGYHRYDCEYTTGLLSTVPSLFDLPRAHVVHSVCGASGGACCEFEARWTNGTQGLTRAALAVAAGGGVLATASALAEPKLLAVAAGVLAAGELAIAARAIGFMHRRLRSLERRVAEQDDAAERLLSSLQDLSSDLRLEEVLEQITERAQTAVGGQQFALLLDDDAGMRPDRHSGIPLSSLALLASWAEAHRAPLLGQGAIVIDDLATDALLAKLPREAQAPFGSICAAPLVFRDRLLGVLVALAPGSTVFLPADVAALSAYAAHASIALSNARLVERLQRQAAEDPLTGLYNQRAFFRQCAVEFGRGERSGASVSIVMLDLDFFKKINDDHGHPYGDQILLGVADALRDSVRKQDTVARMGGEEFAMLLPETDATTAYELAERARAAIAGVPVNGNPLSCSAGVAAMSSGDTTAPLDLLELADKALYQAKHLGRDRTVEAGSELCPDAQQDGQGSLVRRRLESPTS
jgi:diguanylate cyclase (GGDEF)-like protein